MNATIRRCLPLAGRLLVAAVTLLAGFTVLLTLANCIPHSAVADGTTRSVHTIFEEGQHPVIWGEKLNRLDNFTDALILNMTFMADERQPLQAAMRNRIAYKDNLMEGTRRAFDEPTAPYDVGEYNRYWHGHQLLVRPMMVVTDLRGLRVFNCIVMSVLLILLVAFTWLRLGWKVAAAVTAVVLWVALPSVPLCMQFAHVFYVALVAALWVVARRQPRTEAPVTAFFVIGACTSYVDLLTVPLVTLALPGVLAVMHSDTRSRMRSTWMLVLAWAAGYFGLWAAKWLMVWAVTGEGMAEQVMHYMAIHTWSEHYTPWTFVGKMQFSHAPHMLVGASLLALLYVLFARGRKAFVDNAWLLIFAGVYVLWVLVLFQHTVWHFAFTWRGTLALVLPVLLFVMATLGPLRWGRWAKGAAHR